jgi:hypothetical protein
MTNATNVTSLVGTGSHDTIIANIDTETFSGGGNDVLIGNSGTTS